MTDKPNNQDELDLRDGLTNDEIDSLVKNIQLMPEHPLPKGFVEEAMANWRKSQRVLPPTVEPTPISLQLKMKILFSQGYWKDCMLGILLFLIGLIVLTITKLVPSMLILPIVGCIPLLVVVSNTARHALCGMSELTRSLRIPLQWYLQARLLLVGVVSLLINGVAIVIAFPVSDGNVLLRVALLWGIPTLLNAAVALILTARIRSFGQLVAMLVLLPVFWMILLASEQAIYWTASIDIYWLGLLTMIAALFLLGTLFINGRYLKKGGFLIGT